MRKPTLSICENKVADHSNCKEDGKHKSSTFQASSHLLCLYSSVCVRPVQKPHCRFSHDFAHTVIIMKICPCNVYPLEPHFYIAKLGYAGIYLFFLFLLQNIDCGYSLEPPHRGGSNVYPQSMF